MHNYLTEALAGVTKNVELAETHAGGDTGKAQVHATLALTHAVLALRFEIDGGAGSLAEGLGSIAQKIGK